MRAKLIFITCLLFALGITFSIQADFKVIPSGNDALGTTITKPAAVNVKPNVLPRNIAWMTPDQASKKPLPADRPMLLFVTTEGCSYCVRMKRETFLNQAVINQVAKSYTALRVDAMKYQKLSKKLGVTIFPTTVIIQADGNVVEVMQGYRGPADFVKRLKTVDMKLAKRKREIAAKRNATLKK